MTADIAAAKKALRRQAAKTRAGLLEKERFVGADRLAGHAEALARLALPGGEPGTVAGFFPLADEIDPRPLMLALAERGWTLALPRIEDGEIAFYAWAPGAPLAAGPFGLSEPPGDAPAVIPQLILAPLLAFDRAGNRLGYGKGYYDRALERIGWALAVGVAFAVQEVAAVPVGGHDRRLQIVVTERELIDCRG